MSFLLLSIIFTISCSKNEEKVYSCDNEANEFVQNNSKGLQGISYDSLISYNIIYQKAIFRLQSKENKYSLWLEKFTRMILLQWSDEQLSFIENIKNSLDVKWYDEQVINQEYRDSLFLKWNDKAAEVGLTRNMLFSIVGRMDIIIDPNNPECMMATGGTGYNGGGGGPQHDCDCSQGDDWCSDPMNCQSSSLGCNTSAHGCGWVWTHKCNGDCQ